MNKYAYKYNLTHEWALLQDDGNVLVGISCFAQESLGDIVFVELPEVSNILQQNEKFGLIESVKAVSDIYMPVSGKIIAINTDVFDKPELINLDAYKNWLIIVEPSNIKDLDKLLDFDTYNVSCV